MIYILTRAMKETIWTIPPKASTFYPELKIQVIKKKSLYEVSVSTKKGGEVENR